MLDSVGALKPESYDDDNGDPSSQHWAVVARLLTTHLKQVSSVAKDTGTISVYVNQMRANMKQMSRIQSKATGGYALGHQASLALHVTRVSTKQQIVKTGSVDIKVAVEKNVVAMPFVSTTMTFKIGHGFDLTAQLVDVAINRGIIKQSGAWFTFGEHKWQGKAAATFAIGEDPALEEDIKKLL